MMFLVHINPKLERREEIDVQKFPHFSLKRLSPLREQREREREKEQHKNKELKSSNRFYNDATSVISRKRRIIRR
jgi:hypothetical protein